MKLSNIIEVEYESVTEKSKKDTVYNKKNAQAIIHLFQEWTLKTKEYMIIDDYERDQNALEETLSKIDYTAPEITQFCFALRNIDKETYSPFFAGFFLTALISADYVKTKTKEPYLLITEELPLLHCIGYALQGENIEIMGSVGNLLGTKMIEGNIHVQGSAGDYCGIEMNGGKIIVDNFVSNFCGDQMNDGEILIKKNANYLVGRGMNGGYIQIKEHSGTDLGHYNNGGTIVVCKNAGDDIGYGMKKGIIVIKGDTACRLGTNMHGGTIIVEGDAGKNIGEIIIPGEIETFSFTGRIYLDGTFSSLSQYSKKINIFHKGKKVERKR